MDSFYLYQSQDGCRSRLIISLVMLPIISKRKQIWTEQESLKSSQCFSVFCLIYLSVAKVLNSRIFITKKKLVVDISFPARDDLSRAFRNIFRLI